MRHKAHLYEAAIKFNVYVAMKHYINTNAVWLSKESNIVEAAAAGASQSLPLVANIVGNLIAFLAILTFVNVLVSWLGGLVGHPEWSFQVGVVNYKQISIAAMFHSNSVKTIL